MKMQNTYRLLISLASNIKKLFLKINKCRMLIKYNKQFPNFFNFLCVKVKIMKETF